MGEAGDDIDQIFGDQAGDQGNAGSGSEKGSGVPFVAQLFKHEGECRSTQNGGNDQDHRVDGKQILVAFHIFEVIEQVGIAAIQRHTEQELTRQCNQVGLVLKRCIQLLFQ